MTRFCWITGIILLASGLCFGAAEKLIVSNYPEEISEPGVLVSTPLGGKLTRLMYYHIGRAESEYEINTVLENQTGVPVTLKVRSAPGGPSRDGIYAGHRSAVGFWNAKLKNQSSRVTIPPYQHVTVFSQPLRPQMVSTAVLDFETESDGEIQL
ncbi:hypothetical protein EBR96_05420, partial [bacterium]|nr:hypothetical protein [bacterium]